MKRSRHDEVSDTTVIKGAWKRRLALKAMWVAAAGATAYGISAMWPTDFESAAQRELLNDPKLKEATFYPLRDRTTMKFEPKALVGRTTDYITKQDCIKPTAVTPDWIQFEVKIGPGTTKTAYIERDLTRRVDNTKGKSNCPRSISIFDFK